MQPWRPPPKPMKEKGLTLSSSRGSAKRSGSYWVGFLNTPGSMCEKEGEVATMSPWGVGGGGNEICYSSLMGESEGLVATLFEGPRRDVSR